MVGRPQCRHRLPLWHRRFELVSGASERTDRRHPRRHCGGEHAGGAGVAPWDIHRADRVLARGKSDRPQPRPYPCTSRPASYRIHQFTARPRMPMIYPFRAFVDTGGLLSYGIDQVDIYRQAASYVDRILKGEKPAELPVQAPTKFELIVNLKTAKALGLDVPWILQQRADEVIE